MSKTVTSKPYNAGRRWLHIAKRILVAVIMVIAIVGVIVNVAELVAVWSARAPARSAVTYVSATMISALVTVDNGLTRVNDRVQNARQKLTQVNDVAAKLGDRIQASSPLITQLSQVVNNDLAPRIENVRTAAVSIHDAVVSVNSKLDAFNRIPNLTVPTLTDQLSSVSDRAQEAQTAVEDLRVTLADIKAGSVTKAKTAVMQLTGRIDAPLVRIQATVNKYQATVTRTKERISTARDTLLTLIDALVVSLTLLLIIFTTGLVLLIYICWQYVRHGRFPSLRVVTANASGGSVSKQVAVHDSGTQAEAIQAKAVQTEPVQAEDTLSSEIPAEEKDSPTSAESPTIEKTTDSHTEGSA